MEVSVKNLVVRNEKFQFRYRLPVNFLSGKIREIRISLRTKDLKKAVLCCRLASEKMRTLIDSGEYMSIPLQDLRKIAANYITHRLEDHTRQMAEWGRMCEETQQDGARIALNLVKHHEKAAKENNPDATTALANARDLLNDIPHEQSDINLLAQELLHADRFVHRMQYERITGKRFLT